MHNPTDNQKSNYDDPVWYFLAEYTLNNLMVDDDSGNGLAARLLFQATHNLGMSLEFLKSIERSLNGFAKEAMVRFNRDCLDSPVTIRVFCPKKTIEELNTFKKSSRFPEELTTGLTRINLQSDTKRIGGWGFFLIERCGGLMPGSPENTFYLVDLYLYKEGG